MKKLLISLVCFITIISSSLQVNALSYEVDNAIENDYINLEEDIEVELVIFDSVYEYINVIQNNENIPAEEKNRLVVGALASSRKRSTYQYGYLRFPTKISDFYFVNVYFYIRFQYDGLASPTKMVKVEWADLNRGYGGEPRQFSGKLYYKLIAGNSLHWNLNGDFYNNGSTTVSAGGSIGIGGSASLNFSVSTTKKHYRYVNIYHTYNSSGMEP